MTAHVHLCLLIIHIKINIIKAYMSYIIFMHSWSSLCYVFKSNRDLIRVTLGHWGFNLIPITPEVNLQAEEKEKCLEIVTWRATFSKICFAKHKSLPI